MKRALQDISDMTTSLEASGVERRQAGATLEAIANSIEKFAVTPERLRQALDASQQTLYERIKGEMDQRFEAVNQRFDDLTENVNQRFNDLRQQQHADSSKLFNLMLAIAMGMAGVVGGLVLNKLF
ncbi:MAG: hypothetical protein OXJ53_09745 [Gammaproteobacteria bacterium]|nr:hypothetical protein [Gammaproteobacteria bacterium]MDE0273998.1 hypothetical protein [Gammaproteobacteria bacterium]